MKLHLNKTLLAAVLATMAAPLMAEDLTVSEEDITLQKGDTYENVTIVTPEEGTRKLILPCGVLVDNVPQYETYTITGTLTMGADTQVVREGAEKNSCTKLCVGDIVVTQDGTTAKEASIIQNGWSNLEVAGSINVSNYMNLKIQGPAVKGPTVDGVETNVSVANLSNSTLTIGFWGSLKADVVNMDSSTLTQTESSKFTIGTLNVNSGENYINADKIGVMNVNGAGHIKIRGGYNADTVNLTQNATFYTGTIGALNISGGKRANIEGNVTATDVRMGAGSSINLTSTLTSSGITMNGNAEFLISTSGRLNVDGDITMNGGNVTFGGFTGGDSAQIKGRLTGSANTLTISSLYNGVTIKGWTENDYVAETRIVKADHWTGDGTKSIVYDAEGALASGGEIKAWGDASNEVVISVAHPETSAPNVALKVRFQGLTADQDYSVKNDITIAAGNEDAVILDFSTGHISLDGDLHVNSALTLSGGQDITLAGGVHVAEGQVITVDGTTTVALGESSVIYYDAALPTTGAAFSVTADGTKTALTGEFADSGVNGFKRVETGETRNVTIFSGTGAPTVTQVNICGDMVTVAEDGSYTADLTDYRTFYVTQTGASSSEAATAAAAKGTALESVSVLQSVAPLTVDSDVKSLDIASGVTIDKLTVNGGSATSAQQRQISDIEVTNGRLTLTSTPGGDWGQKGLFTTATINKGGVLALDKSDALGYASGANSNAESITMQGGSGEGGVATLELGARQTMSTNLTLKGDTLITKTASPTGTGDNTPSLDLYGGAIDVTGTNNVNEAGMRIRGDGSSTITVNDDSQFTQKGDIFNHNEGTATKAGEGTLRIEGISKFNRSTIETQAGKTEIAGKVESGKFVAAGGEVVVDAITDEAGHSFTDLKATAGQITLADNAKLTMKEIPTDTGTGTTTNALSVDGATLKVGANNSVTGNVTIGQTGVLTIGATDASALTVTGTLAFGEGATVNLTGLNVTGAGDLTLASATTISATTVNVTGLGLDTSLYQWALYAGSKVVAASDSSLVGTTAVYADGGDLVLSVSDLPSTTLTETTVSAVAVTGTNIQLTVADSLAGVTGGFNVKVGEDMWDAIVQGLDGNGGVYQNGTVTLTDGVNTLDWATLTAPVTLNGYAGTGTAGEYFVAFIPEPATGTLSVLALAALAARRRRKH